VVGGTGLYLRAALSELELQPPVPAGVRDRVEQEIAERGPEALYAELDPGLAAGVHPSDRKRIARLTELSRVGIEPPSGAGALWTAQLRRPTLLIGLIMDRGQLTDRIDSRVDAMVAAHAADEARRAAAMGASRTARAALGFEELLAGDKVAMKRAHRAYARRQLTWMRRMEGVTLIDRTGRADQEIAVEVVDQLDRVER
jgi:tRNA dimethylallyltransferase